MKKKLLSLLLCTSMLATLVAGCGSKAKEADKQKEGEPTTLTMWLPPLDEDTEGNFKKLLAGWEKENNCTVEMEIIPWGSYEERWSTGVAGGETPDIGYMYVEMYPTYISSGLVTDLSDMVEEEDYKEYLFLDRGE